MIRASQGHSIEVELGYEPQKPPLILYHGTALSNKDSILKNGIEKRNRQHVHLSSDTETALNVGKRHGKPIISEILSEEMFLDGFEFFISENNVWLTEFIPIKYIKIQE